MENKIRVVIDGEGSNYYYKDNKLHRDNDLPAIESSSGSKWWYQDGKLNRKDNLPTVVFYTGSKRWHKNGKFHRLEGPAKEDFDGTNAWYLNGEQIHCKNNKEFLRIVKLKHFI